MGLACLAAVLAGFAPSYYLRDAARAPLSALFLAHGAILTAWHLIAPAQPFWISSSQFHSAAALPSAGC